MQRERRQGLYVRDPLALEPDGREEPRNASRLGANSTFRRTGLRFVAENAEQH